jgi:dihydroorotase (multifunctional complex type)
VTVDRVIAGGQVVTADGIRPADVLVDRGKIVGLVAAGTAPSDAGEVIRADGHHVLPGSIDVHVHLREPGYTHKEDITTGTEAAAAGGVTTVFGMPNVDPPTVSRELLDEALAIYATKSLVDYNHNPAATDPEQAERMADAGIAAFKVYMVVDTGRTYPHPAGTGLHDHGRILEMMERIAPTGLPFMIHPHDQAIMDYIEQSYWAQGDRSPQAYAKTLAAYDGVIWDTAIGTILRLAEATGCRLHVVHAQTPRTLELVRQAKDRGLDVTAEVNHWALFLSRWEDVERLGSYALSYFVPDESRAACWEGLNDGTFDIIASDHAPHTREEKDIGWTDAWAAHTGTPGIQYQLPLLLDAARQGLTTIEQAVRMACTRPAEIFGLRDKGRLAPGCDADLVIADLDADWTITNDSVRSRCGWTPYDGRRCTTRIVRTTVRGVDVWVDGEVTGTPGHGEQARPTKRPSG